MVARLLVRGGFSQARRPDPAARARRQHEAAGAGYRDLVRRLRGGIQHAATLGDRGDTVVMRR